jgi:HEAT repeat protein
VNDINQLLVLAEEALNHGDWSLLIQYLQQIILANPEEIAPKEQQVLAIALCALEYGDFHQRWDMTKIFIRLGSISIKPLIGIIEDEEVEDECRWYAIKILGAMKNEDAILSLIQLFTNHNNNELKEMAAAALGEIGVPAIPFLAELLHQQETIFLATRALAYIRHSETITPLLGIVESSPSEVRSMAIEALGSFHDPRIPPILLKALDDITHIVRKEAVKALGFRPDLQLEFDLVKHLESKLYDFNLDVCCAAADSLSRMHCLSAGEALFNVLISPHTPTKLQLESIRALAWIETESGLEYLGKALYKLEAEEICLEIFKVLGRLQNPKLTILATNILLDALVEKYITIQSKETKNAISLSLGKLGNILAIEPLIRLLGDSDKSVRLHALAALKNFDPHIIYGKVKEFVQVNDFNSDQKHCLEQLGF